MDAKQTIEAFNRSKHHASDDCLLVRKLRDAGLSVEQVAATITAIESTCPHCFDAEAGCQCWNDE